MTWHPLQHGVADEHVKRPLGTPFPHVPEHERQIRRRLRCRRLRCLACTVLACAAAIISGELSTPITVASGQRWASAAVRLPGPQPRSATYRGLLAPT